MPDGAQAQEGVALRLFHLCLCVLVRAKIAGANGERLALEQGDGAQVRVHVILLSGRLLAGEPEELGSVEPNAIAAVGEHRFHFLWELNVAHELDTYAALGDGLVPGEFAHGRAGALRSLLLAAVLLKRARIRTENDNAIIAVNNQLIAVFHFH